MSDETETIAGLKARALRFRDARSWRLFHPPKDPVLARAAARAPGPMSQAQRAARRSRA